MAISRQNVTLITILVICKFHSTLTKTSVVAIILVNGHLTMVWTLRILWPDVPNVVLKHSSHGREWTCTPRCRFYSKCKIFAQETHTNNRQAVIFVLLLHFLRKETAALIKETKAHVVVGLLGLFLLLLFLLLLLGCKRKQNTIMSKMKITQAP